MKKLYFLLILICIVVLSMGVYLYYRDTPSSNQSDLSVITTFYPLAEFTRQVGGQAVTVETIVPNGTEPHEYEPTPQQISKMYQASIFIYNGNGLDPWAEHIAPDLQKQGVHVINMTEQLHLASRHDPHFWLDPVLAHTQVAVIRDALMARDVENNMQYQQQAETYLTQLKNLDIAYRTGLQTCARRDIVSSHDAFSYLAERYNLQTLTIAGLSPEEEPSARKISEIAQLAQEKNISYIFFETLISPRLAETVAEEIGAQTLVFNPLEGLTPEEIEAGQDYISIMQDNLQNLRLALQCQ